MGHGLGGGEASNEKYTKSVTEKWRKGRGVIQEFMLELNVNPNKPLEFKRMERDRCFLCHMAMIFDQDFPYLKGFHLTLCSHVRRRDEEGWKTQELEWIGHVEKQLKKGKWSREEADEMIGELVYNPKLISKMIKVVPRFHTCLKALCNLFKQKKCTWSW